MPRRPTHRSKKFRQPPKPPEFTEPVVETLAAETPEQVNTGSLLRQVILGGQDGVVNVLGVILGVATATSDLHLILIAGLAATFAESISMAAVAYTSSRAAQDYYRAMLEKERREVRELPHVERKEIYDIYSAKGFRGRLLDDIVNHITSNKERWVSVMMNEELGLSESENVKPVNEAVIVGFSALVGSFLPLTPYFLLPLSLATYATVLVSVIALFSAGVYKANITTGSRWKSGLELAGVGITAALAGYAIGAAVGFALP